MSLYDGFFDATQNEDTGEYDRTYSTDDFAGYFAKIIGSGVCVHNNPDSFLVRLEEGQAVVSPGYLFISGYWLKNDADYTIALPESRNYAIVARLNLGTRMIELEARTVETAYTDSLVLAIVSPSAAEDTRYNTDLCGVIDTAGELSTKVEWALNYIDNEIESKLAGVEAEIAAQAVKLDAKIAAVQAVVDSIVPPPIGTIQFSASQNVGNEWLPCDGRFINEKDYPELVAALGKLTPSDDKFTVISDGEIGPQISNGVIYDGCMWVYSYSAQKLYGVDVDGAQPVKVIDITSTDSDFTRVHVPSMNQPIALSIVKSPIDGKARVFLAQILENSGTISGDLDEKTIKKYFWLYSAQFTGSESSLAVSAPFKSATAGENVTDFDSFLAVPYVVSENVGGTETFYVAIGTRGYIKTAAGAAYDQGIIDVHLFQWSGANDARTNIKSKTSGATSKTGNSYEYVNQRAAFSKKNKNELVRFDVFRYVQNVGGTTYTRKITSYNSGIFNGASYSNSSSSPRLTLQTQPPLSIIGADKLIFDLTTQKMSVVQNDSKSIEAEVSIGLSLPSAARVFVDGGAYLWGKDIYMLFVGTGIIFSRTLEAGSFGYLDTTSVLGTITQFGYLDYSEDEMALYLLGQDTTNSVKVAKIVLNDLYDYANDGAWLPMIASDGVPAYIKAREAT